MMTFIDEDGRFITYGIIILSNCYEFASEDDNTFVDYLYVRKGSYHKSNGTIAYCKRCKPSLYDKRLK